MDAAVSSLDPDTVVKLANSAGESPRHGVRNCLLIRLMYGHALRLAEIVGLTWGMLDMDEGRMRVKRRRTKEWDSRPLKPHELTALRHLCEESGRPGKKDPVFAKSSGRPLTPDGVRKMIASAAVRAEITQPTTPRALRHAACVRVGKVTKDVDAVRAFMGAGQRGSAVSVLPVRNVKKLEHPLPRL